MTAVVRFEGYCMPEPNSGCWLWTGTTNRGGYGVFSFSRAKSGVAAHRASWMIHKGEIPGGLWVLHKCDNPACVNPDHLFLGTAKDNTADMMRKGRWRAPVVINRARGDRHRSRTAPESIKRGEAHHSATITEADVQAIRLSAEAGVALARRYGLTPTSITRIRLRKSWRHVA
jgi:hypothetical protein